MKEAAQELNQQLKDYNVQDATIPVISNVTARAQEKVRKYGKIWSNSYIARCFGRIQ